MKQADWKKCTLGAAATVIMLPLAGTAMAGDPVTAQASRGANHCIELGTQHRMTRDSITDVTPVLSNRCDYAVNVSYCIAEADADVRACDNATQRITRAVPAHGAVRVQHADRLFAGRDVNWIACRALLGGSTQFNADGTRGQCLSASDTMQASAQRSR